MIIKALGGAAALMLLLGVLGKIEQIHRLVSATYQNQLVLAGYDPATGKKLQPERYQIFEQAAQ